MKFKQINDSKVLILNDKDEEVGHIFSPAGSGEDVQNAIQVCGFSEAYDYWGCGVYQGFKDIQLLFDGKSMDGTFNTSFIHDTCVRCYMTPCQCEVKREATGKMLDDTFKKGEPDYLSIMKKHENPFIVKRSNFLGERLKHSKKDRKND